MSTSASEQPVEHHVGELNLVGSGNEPTQTEQES
jgi:hypothetical protein